MKKTEDITIPIKVVSYMISFQEVPDEVSLVLNISNCGLSCDGCHSPELQKDSGELLTSELMISLINKHIKYISCVCFMGGYKPNNFSSLHNLIYKIKLIYPLLKVTLYTGYSLDSDLMQIATSMLDYLKVGSYIKKLGGLNTKETNQRFYSCSSAGIYNITSIFNKGNLNENKPNESRGN